MTNETQKTAVEWYSRRLFEIEIAHNQGVINSDVYLKSKTHALERAKEMEKEQRSIELPSDEEIKKSTPYPLSKGFYNPLYSNKWEEGAKWMRNKIQGGEQ
jgi:hypothetical protein